MSKLELETITIIQLTRLLRQERWKGRHWSCAHHVCICVCVFNRPTLRFSIENASKRLDYPVVVYRGAVPAFCRCYHLTGRWLAALWVEKHGLIEEPLTGAVFESVARRTARTATNAVCVQGFGGIVQLLCAWLALTDASST